MLKKINKKLITMFLVTLLVISFSLLSVLLFLKNVIKEDNKDSLKSMDIVMAVDNLEYIWLQDESNMCFMVNHKNIQEIGQEIVRLKTYIAHDEIIEFKVSLEEIKHYCYGYLHFMGANVHNVL